MCSNRAPSETKPKDILERLRPLLELGADCSVNMADAKPLIQDAIKEIVYLRYVAGAVTAGPSHAEIKRAIKQPAPGED